LENVIITGPTGAVGRALIDELLKKEIKVTAVCHEGSKRAAELEQLNNVRVVYLNLDRISSLPDLLMGESYDTFYHLAWDGTFGNTRNNMPGQINNIRYSIDAVNAAKKLGVIRFIGAGSQAEYGRVSESLKSDTPAFPENGYGMAKLCAGQMTRELCNTLDIEHIWVRILSVFGPHDGDDTMVSQVIKKLLSGEILPLSKGEQIWDYLYSKDCGRAMYLVGEKGVSEKVYVIGSGKKRHLSEFIKTMRDIINPEVEIERGMGLIPYSDKQVMHLVADISELINDTGFQIEYSFEEGVRETVEFIKNNM